MKASLVKEDPELEQDRAPSEDMTQPSSTTITILVSTIETVPPAVPITNSSYIHALQKDIKRHGKDRR